MKYTILAALANKLQNKVGSFERKFQKYGVGFITYKVSEPYRCADEKSPYYKKVVVDVDVEGTYKVNNFTFVASLEWQDSIQKI